jgi:membrane-bound metal-dependent hydrolase YbcI (DUF457 family)
MIAATHIAFAGLCAIAAQGLGLPLTPDVALTLTVGALLPDIDVSTSGLGKFTKPLSSLIERKFGHRTITHSILGVAIMALMAFPLYLANPNAYFYLLIGIISHILLDTANIAGVPLLYPSRLQFWLVPNRNFRLPYGTQTETNIAIGFAISAMVLYPISGDGFGTAFHRFMGTPAGVVEDYLLWRDDHEVYAELTGFNTETQEKVSGKFRVIDAIGKEGVILETPDGHALGMGRAAGAQITVYRTAANKGQRIYSRETRLELAGRTVGDLLRSLPQNARNVWVTANIQSNSSASVVPPTIGAYSRIKSLGKTLELRTARPNDLAPLANVYIEHGSAIIRAEYGDGDSATAANIQLPAESAKVHTLEIPNLPSMAGLVVAEGDLVEVGNPIARYVNDAALTAKQAEQKQATLVLVSATKSLKNLQAEYQDSLTAIKARLTDAQSNLKRMDILVTGGAEPPIKLVEAKRLLREASNAHLSALNTLTSRRADLERTAQAAQLRLQQAKAEQDDTMQKQWMKSPVKGQIAEVKVKATTAKGITLSVIIVEETKMAVAP